MLLVQGQHPNEEGVPFVSQAPVILLFTPASPSASPHQVPMCLYLPPPSLVYIGPLDSVRDP